MLIVGVAMSQHASWTPEIRRAFKEVLYRFMGEVNATKAALYLKTEDDDWSLVTQYGFGRRDRLIEIHHDDDAIVRMVRAFGEDPRFYNQPAEIGELASYLADAGTERMMLVPLEGRFVGLLGFVDVRDKGGRRPFTADDLTLARTIAGELTGLAEDVRDDDTAVEPEIDDADEALFELTESSGGGEVAGYALLDDGAIDELIVAAVGILDDSRVAAVALSLVGGNTAAMIVQQRSTTPAVEIGPVVAHQTEALSLGAAPIVPREAWKTEVRRVPGSAGTADNPIIASGVLLEGEGAAMAASVVADGEPEVPQQALQRLARRAGEARDRFRLRLTRRGLARRLLQPGDRRYPELAAHSLGVSRLCWSIARVLELDEDAIENAALAGLLHDVGMRELDYDRLYMKPTPGPEDRRTYRMHVEVGDRIVRVEGFEEIADAVRHHHERWDGNGYPDRLAGAAIPLLARIVHVAEVFDLFTAANSYRPAVSNERALAILDRAAGHQFDPEVVGAIARVVA
ncbi:MAG: HD domain-containing phosphohydrolase [Thermoanaerobaculales bacterium]|jgi:putative nucleotidyltransferase with HDIG domain|nr:HD domain-containing phosphohydrolase [Thermoanaerobaculales bacterium]